jgi:hypothetical protein
MSEQARPASRASSVQTNLERALLEAAPVGWRVRQIIVFEWLDGPREGICEMEHPPGSFYFEILAESAGDFADRLFALSELRAGVVGEVIEVFRGSGPPKSPVWAPHGAYASDEEQQRIEDAVERLTSLRTPMRILIRTRDMIKFTEVWIDTRLSSS